MTSELAPAQVTKKQRARELALVSSVRRRARFRKSWWWRVASGRTTASCWGDSTQLMRRMTSTARFALWTKVWMFIWSSSMTSRTTFCNMSFAALIASRCASARAAGSSRALTAFSTRRAVTTLSCPAVSSRTCFASGWIAWLFAVTFAASHIPSTDD